MKSVWETIRPAFGTGILVATAAVAAFAQFCITWLTVCGISTPSAVAVLSGLAIGSAFAERSSNSSQKLIFAVGVAGLSVMTSVTLDSALSWGVAASTSLAASSNFAFVLTAGVAAAFSWILRSWFLSSAANSSNTAICIGAAIGCLVPLFNSVAVFPLWIAPVGLLTLATITSTKFAATDEPHQVAKAGFSNLVSVAGFGLFCHACLRTSSLLTPNSTVLLLVSVASLAACAALLSTRIFDKLLQHPLIKFGCVTSIVLFPQAFSLLVQTNLGWNSTVDSVWTITLLRSLQLAALFGSGMLVLRIVTHRKVDADDNLFQRMESSPSVLIAGLAIGVLFTAWGLPIAVQTFFGAIVIASPAVWSRKFNPYLATGIAACGMLVCALADMNSAATSQKLFSARAANALRLGLTMDVVDQSHCTRLVDAVSGETGQLTVWKTSAEMVELRRDGIPAGLISTNEVTTPQTAPEILTAVLPLVMHRNPQRVLVLGDDTGMSTRVCCSFPIPSIEATRPDTAATHYAARYAWDDLATSPLDDERVTIRNETVAAASRRSRKSGGKLDVVIAASPNPVSMLSQEQLTTLFYKNLKHQLSDDGVFCQRITQHDLGPEPIHRILSSLSSVFGRVVVFQMAAGEMAMLAGVDEDSLLDSQLLDRLQRLHVVRELGRSGWDWSQVAALPVVDTSDPVGVFEHNPALPPADAGNGFFALMLPLESARWGNKPMEVRSMFGPHQQRMADAAPRGKSYPEFARRYSAVIQQMEILSTFHDEPFAYRQSLKTEMQRNPRPAIEKIRGGKITQNADPRDEYRKHYFVSLGSVLKQAAEGFADPLALKELTGFTTRYEPLLSFFAHHELIRIHEVTDHPGPAMELQHRLHTIFFADGRDYSVRQITAAMNQIVENPELLPSDAARFDHLNAMLQELVRRWEGRRSHTPKSARRTQADVDACVKASNRSLDLMEKLADSVDMPRPKFLARRKFINKALVAPLRTYGEQVLAHRIKTEPPLESLDQLINDDLPLLATPVSDLAN